MLGLNRAFDGIYSIQSLTLFLRELASSFSATGNNVIAKKLTEISIEIDKQVELINTAITEDLNEQFDKSQKQLGQTVAMVLKKICEKT